MVLIRERTLPYSFFRYIFVNQTDYETGKIEKELLLHEEAHSEQFHSIDILIIELMNLFLWFNPVIRKYRKEIMLNHEYSADNTVLNFIDMADYQLILVNVLLRNNSNYLVSNFKFSLIKNRLAMMSKNKPSDNAILRKISAIIIFLAIGIALTFSKENVRLGNISIPMNELSAFIYGNEKPDLFPVRKGEYNDIPRKFGEKYTNEFRKNPTIHSGIDIIAETGTDVVATAGGEVLKAELNGSYGNTIIIGHGDGYQSTYAHLKDFIVKKGDTVTKGQTIGHVGSTGLSTGPHLHFEISLNGEKVNPLLYIK
jgi:murein DD-endopeptidase MepM/ murein hydrolase activator NlpD